MATSAKQTDDIYPIKVEFTGGLEMLFAHVKEHNIELPVFLEGQKRPTVSYLVHYLCDKVMKDRRKELFVQDGSVRPGILVLINDADWELEGEGEYVLQPGDNIVFVSTLHGG